MGNTSEFADWHLSESEGFYPEPEPEPEPGARLKAQLTGTIVNRSDSIWVLSGKGLRVILGMWP